MARSGTIPAAAVLGAAAALWAVSLAAPGARAADTASATAPASAPAAEGVEGRPVLPSSRTAPNSLEGQRLMNGPRGGLLEGWQQTCVALAIVLVVLLLLRTLLKRLARPARGGPRGGAIEVLARTAVPPRQQLLLVRVGRRLLVVGSSPAGLSTLAEIADPEEAAELADAAMGGDWRGLLLRPAGPAGDAPPRGGAP